jgi:hypothetical protein
MAPQAALHKPTIRLPEPAPAGFLSPEIDFETRMIRI